MTVMVAVLGRTDVPVRLLPGLAGGDEDDLVKVEERLDLARGDEVTVVNGVEGAAHHPDAPGATLAPSGPVRARRAERAGAGR